MTESFDFFLNARDPETGDTVAYPLDTLDDGTVTPDLSCDTDG